MRLLTAVVLIAVGGLFVLLPDRAIELTPVAAGPAPVRGVIHVHTRRSDGTGTVDDVARAAAQAGLSFVVITDHGDAARTPEPPAYRQGVLCIDAVEISTEDGHVVALGLPQAPYPLGGEARDVVEDVHRLGGWAMAAHPGSPRDELAWRDWTVPVDAIEWVNGDSEWRDESVPALLRALLTYPLRPAESLAALLDRPDPVMARWDALTAERPVVGLAAVDAHARIGLTSLGEPYDTRVSLPWPSYAAVFSALSVSVEDVRLSGDAAADSAAVISALRGGRAFSTIDGLARGGRLEFTASAGDATVRQGGTLIASGPITLRIAALTPPSVRTTLVRNGQVLRTVDGGVLDEVVSDAAAVYRVEIALAPPGAQPIPWLVSNPIYVGRRRVAEPPTVRPAASVGLRVPREVLAAARIERSASSAGATSLADGAGAVELMFRYALGGRLSEGPYAAAAFALPEAVSAGSQIRFTARADRPARLAVQLRSPGPDGGDRWRRSIYLDETPRDVAIEVGDMRAVTGTPLDQRLADVDTLLMVVDSLNTALGTGGRIWIRDLEVAR